MTTLPLDRIDGYIQKFLDGVAEDIRQLIVKMAENDAKIAESDAKIAESDAKFKAGFEELRKSLRKTDDNFNCQWSRLVEALVNNQVVTLLKEWGIPVHRTNQRTSGRVGDRNYEFDIIAENGDSIVVIEVKTTLRPDDVREFLDELDHFKQWIPRYSDMKVYGAVAFLHNVSEAANFAAKKGLFTILATGSSATITNPPTFKPREF